VTSRIQEKAFRAIFDNPWDGSAHPFEGISACFASEARPWGRVIASKPNLDKMNWRRMALSNGHSWLCITHIPTAPAAVARWTVH
jgi:hypothetical protein